MTMQSIIGSFCTSLRQFRSASRGNVVTIFALLLVPVLASVGAAVDYSQGSSIKSAMQAAADAASLGTVKLASTLTPAQVQSTAAGLFNASFNRPQATPTVSATYDAASNKVTVNASTSFKPTVMSAVGISQMNLSATSKATIGAKTWQVCVMVTDPDSNHTLMVKNQSKIDFTNCMVQVNTANWDAVEARDTSYIHSANGDNCFVGDIHYGDVQPPKDPTCQFFQDPFSSYTMPASAANCDHPAATTIVAPTTLYPGTYCGGISTSADTVFAKGLYIIKDGNLAFHSSANITANGVTFVFTGDKLFDSGSMIVQIQTTGTINLTPASDADAGKFGGFVFFLDQNTAGSNKHQGKVRIWNTTMNTSGILYLAGASMDISKDAVLNVKPGSIIADFILPDSGTLNLTGTLNSSWAAFNSLKKTGSASGGPVLVN